MKAAFALCAMALLATLSHARVAEKVSEDDDFVVYRIPVRDLDLQSQASRMYEGGLEYGGSHGRSSSKSSSTSKSQSSSTGSGKGKGYGEGSSSHGHGTGHGGSSSGHGYGGGSSGHGSGYGGGSSGHGSGYGGGSSGHGSGYGGGSSGHGSGYGGSGHGGGYGGSGYGHGGSAQGGYGQGGEGYGHGGQASYAPGGYDAHHSSHNYDEDEGDHPKIVTTTKTFTTNSAQDTGLAGAQYRQIPDSVGDLHFRLADYLKNTPGHEGSHKYSPKIFEGYGDYSEAAPAYRSNQNFNVNAFTRSLNQGMGAFKAPSYRNSRIIPQASVIYPTAYALRNAGFGLGAF